MVLNQNWNLRRNGWFLLEKSTISWEEIEKRMGGEMVDVSSQEEIPVGEIFIYIYIYNIYIIYIYIYTHMIQNNLRAPQLASFAHQLGCKKAPFYGTWLWAHAFV